MELIIMPIRDPDWDKALKELQEAALNQGTRRLNVNVPSPLYRRFKVKAAREGDTMSEIVLRLLWDYVKDERLK